MLHTDASVMTLRRADPADAEGMGAVFDAATRAGWRYLGPLVDESMFTLRDWEELVADHAPPNVLLVAIDLDERIIAFAAIHPADGEIFLLFVHPAHGGRGVGRLLLAAAHDALHEADCTDAHLYTHEQNERALAVYAAAGYRPDGTIRESDFRGTRLRELRLVKHLGS